MTFSLIEFIVGMLYNINTGYFCFIITIDVKWALDLFWPRRIEPITPVFVVFGIVVFCWQFSANYYFVDDMKNVPVILEFSESIVSQLYANTLKSANVYIQWEIIIFWVVTNETRLSPTEIPEFKYEKKKEKNSNMIFWQRLQCFIFSTRINYS